VNHISVIVTAYNRKDYLSQALTSLLDQTYKNFDVVLATNFKYDISKFSSLHISCIVLDGNIGKFLIEASKIATGEIIVFLDDDDYFAKNKIETIKNFFDNPSTVYVHNKSRYFNDDTLLNRVGEKIDFNMSSITIRKNLICNHSKLLRELSAAPDSFLYGLALESGGKLINYKKILTYYRQHNNNTSDFNNIKWLLKYKDNLLNFMNYFKSKKALKHYNMLLIIIDFTLFVNLGKKYRPKFADWLLFIYYAIILKEARLLIKSFKMLFFEKPNIVNK
jgi:glycosyltransferase involved in cell wall biosynthesis